MQWVHKNLIVNPGAPLSNYQGRFVYNYLSVVETNLSWKGPVLHPSDNRPDFPYGTGHVWRAVYHSEDDRGVQNRSMHHGRGSLSE